MVNGEWMVLLRYIVSCPLRLFLISAPCCCSLLSAASPLFLDPNLPDNCSLPTLLLVQDCEVEEVTPILDQEAAAQ